MNTKHSFATSDDYERIKTFFMLLDNEFFPELSKRRRGYDLDSILKKALSKGNIGITEKDHNIVAACTYWIEKDIATVTATGVLKQFRGTPIIYELCFYILKKEEQKSVKKIQVKTWSSNSKTKTILGKIGFRKVKTIEEDLHKNRITEIYEIDFDQLKSYFNISKHNFS